MPYQGFKHDFVNRTQKEPWYLKINPNGRIPETADIVDSQGIHVWESSRILKYLVEQCDPEFKFWFRLKTKENHERFYWPSRSDY